MPFRRSLMTLGVLLSFNVPALAEDAEDVGDVSYVRESETATDDTFHYKFITGVDYSHGDYGDTQATSMWYVPATLKAQYGNWTAKITVPYLRITGPGVVVGSGGGSVTQAGTGTVSTGKGLGDIVVSGTYTHDIVDYDVSIDLTGKVKVPTGDEDEGLGTGEVDYTLATEVTKMIGDANISANVARKFVGSNSTLQLHDIWIAGVGAGYKLSPVLDAGVSYDWRQSASGNTQPKDATLYFNYKLTERLNVQVYGVKGLSDASADIGTGMMVGYKF